MHISIWGVHHDEKFWPQPDAFRPERFLAGAAESEGRHPNAFLGFGIGAWFSIRASVDRQSPTPGSSSRLHSWLCCLRDVNMCTGLRKTNPIFSLTMHNLVSE